MSVHSSLDTSHTDHPSIELDAAARLHATGTGRPLIYVPGLDGTGLLFYRQTRLLRHRFRVLTFRLRDEATDMDTLVADLLHHLDVAVPSGEPVVMVGESFGGALAMSFASRHPERVAELVILNSFTRITPRAKLHAALAAMHLVPWHTMQWVRSLTAWRLHSAHTHQDEIRNFLLLTRGTTKVGYRNRLRILTRYDIRPALQRLTMPTLFLAADEDHLLPSVREARLLAASAPAATLRILEGHGHGCFLAPDLDLDQLLHEWASLRSGSVEPTPARPI